VLGILASLFFDDISDAVTLLVGLTALGLGGAHYGAVLAGASERAVKKATAYGFFIGAALGGVTLVVDALV